MSEIVLTKEGILKLENELEHLKSVKRREVAERIKLAIGYGDISENSEYDDAKNEQAFVEGRIITLEKMLRNARIADNDSGDTSVVNVGLKVLVKDKELMENCEFLIVGPAEADVFENKISYESPVGKALMGKRIGEKVEVTAPMGAILYEILDIKV
ncbi:transcription elongation factor GreA [Paenibacillus taichungensis]